MSAETGPEPAASPARLAPTDALPALGARGFSLLSWNVLLPNSLDGWWVPKLYPPRVPDAARAWPHRQARMAAILDRAEPDIICLQECAGESFEADFEFLRERGYDALLHKKYRFRPATFWRRERFRLVDERHGDRTLQSSLACEGGIAHIVNVHLSGGDVPEHRLRQVHAAAEGIARSHRALSGGAPELEAAAIICGDFNASPGSAAHSLLMSGAAGPETRDPSWPERALTSRQRRHPLRPLARAHAAEFGPTGPVTYLSPDPLPKYADLATGRLTAAFAEAVEGIFTRFEAADGMGPREVDAWIAAVNGAPRRGSEWRTAEALLATEGSLGPAQLAEVYRRELEAGRAWALEHDAQRCDARPVDPPGGAPLGRGVIDHILYTPGPLRLEATLPPWDEASLAELEASGGLPSAAHPSDHLPLGAAFTLA